MAANDQIDESISIRTERLAGQAQPSGVLVSQGSAQAERKEITNIINTSGVSAIAGTANQIAASAATGSVTLSLPPTITVATSYQVAGTKVVGARGTAVADAASPDATDLASAITLVNELKAQLNTAFARLRSTTGHGLWT